MNEEDRDWVSGAYLEGAPEEEMAASETDESDVEYQGIEEEDIRMENE